MTWYRWELREYPGRRRRWVAAQTDGHQLTRSVGGRGPRSKSFRHRIQAELWINWRRSKDEKIALRRSRRTDYRVVS